MWILFVLAFIDFFHLPNVRTKERERQGEVKVKFPSHEVLFVHRCLVPRLLEFR